MLKIDFRNPEIEKKSITEDGLILVADVPQSIKLFQGQRLKVKTGVALKTDNHAMAVPLRGNNEIGLIMASGFEFVSDKEGEIELYLLNRNNPGSPRMIEISPMMPIARLIFMPVVETEFKMPEQEETEIEPEAEKSLEEMSVKDLRLILDEQEVEYLVKNTKPELIALIRGQTEDDGTDNADRVYNERMEDNGPE